MVGTKVGKKKRNKVKSSRNKQSAEKRIPKVDIRSLIQRRVGKDLNMQTTEIKIRRGVTGELSEERGGEDKRQPKRKNIWGGKKKQKRATK